MVDFYDDKQPVWSTGEKYIYKNVDGSYTIRRIKNNVRHTYARFKELTDAVKYRDFCELHDWIKCCKRNKHSRGIYISQLEVFYGGQIV